MDKYQITIETYNKCAQQYQDKFMDLALYNSAYDIFCKLINKVNAEVLDVACGPGNITKYLLKHQPNYKILAMDLSVNMIELAKINNPKADFQVLDFRDIGKNNKKYDGIINGFGLPYISKVEVVNFIHNASKKLREKGVLYLSVMEGNYDDSGYKGSDSGAKGKVFIHYYKEYFIVDTLKKNDFKICDIIRIQYPEQKNKYESDLIIIAKKI